MEGKERRRDKSPCLFILGSFFFYLGFFLISLSCKNFPEEDKSVAKIHYYYKNYNNNGLKY